MAEARGADLDTCPSGGRIGARSWYPDRMERPLVLASTSRYRRALLDSLGLRYEALAPDFVEDPTMPGSVEERVVAFARGKAVSLGHARPDALIIGSDQGVELDGQLLGKPGDPARAVAQLLSMAGREHRLLTAVAVHDPAAARTEHLLVVHHMHMRPLTPAQAEAYVRHDRPLDCAGSYKVESLGMALFSAMDGPDHTAIIGLPITATVTLLGRAGVDLLARVVRA